MDERFLRELELDGVARLFPGFLAPARAASDAPVSAAPAPAPKVSATVRTVVAEPMRGDAAPWLVVGYEDVYEGDAGRLLDAMLAAVGLRRRSDEAPPARASVLVLRLGDCSHEASLPEVALADPRQLLREPAGKAAAWEALVRARRLANG